MRKQQRLAWRETTTCQLNLCGNPITSHELVTPLARLIGNQKQAITSKFPRMKLADDGIRFGPGQAIVTPSMIKGEFISEYQTAGCLCGLRRRDRWRPRRREGTTANG